jgi:hypothetical protein
VKKISQLALVCLGFVPGPALAWDWSLISTLSQTVELNDNQFLRTPSTGGSLGSYSTIGAHAVGLTPTSRLTVDSDVGYRKYWGPGTDGVSQTESDWIGISAHYVTWGKNSDDRVFFDGSFRRSSTVVAVLGDLGFLTNAHGDLDRTFVQGGFQRSLSALDTFTFSVSSALTTYDPASSGTQFVDTTATASWRHRVDPLTTVSLTSQAEWLNYDTQPTTNLLLFRNTAGFETNLTSVLSYGASAGVIYTDAEIGSTPSPIIPIALQPAPFATGSTVGFIADAHAIYRILKNTTLNLTAAHSISPSITGVLTKRSTIHAGVTQLINARSSVSVAGDISRQTAFGSTNDFLSGSVSYAYQLAREWNASVTYRYLHRTANAGNALLDPVTGLPTSNIGAASSNSLMVTVAKTTTIIPPSD